MTPERQQRFEEILSGVLHVDPAERRAWLEAACGDDEALRESVVRLLDQGDLATRTVLIHPEGDRARTSSETRSWHSRSGARARRVVVHDSHEDEGSLEEISGFSPRPVIATGSEPQRPAAAASVVRSRLRELPIIHILVLGMTSFWRCKVFGDDDAVLRYVDASVIGMMAVAFILLWSPWRLSLARLQALELAILAILAARLGFVEYRLVLRISLDDDPMMAQLIVKNVVLLTAILIPSYGLYVPKNWRRAAVVAGPLAILPFAPLAVLSVRHPGAMSWLGRAREPLETSGVFLFSFDALILAILAVASTLGAGAISLLRRQIVEARQLGQYRLGKRIGEGGMGEVYLAEHQLLKRPCALKLIRADSVADPRALARFEREVRLTASLSHPNTVEIYDYGRAEDGRYYYVMEYLPGLSLEELVEAHGPLPPGRVVYLLGQICHALQEAHAAGLVHRDIKPSNILVSRRGGMDDMAKILDFGLVLPLAHADAPHLSGERQILGTPLFMSPEQAGGHAEVGPRSDIYSLGAVAYFLLTGRPPFDAKNEIQVLVAHARQPVTSPSVLRREVPEDLELVVLRCLAKSPKDRYPDCEQLAESLSACECSADWDQARAAAWWRGRSC